MSEVTHGAASALVAEIREVARQVARRVASETRKVASGTVERRDQDGTLYVRMDGAEEATPVNGEMLAEASIGHRVSVRAEGGKLSIVGNATEPSKGATGVSEVVDPVKVVAEGAARESARASRAANDAEQAAEAAQASASSAQDSAEAAGVAAESAQESADIGLYQLSVLEDVVGTVQWFAEHATYSATADTAVETGKTYYELVDGTYRPAAVPAQTYVPTEDETPQEDVIYYVISGGTYVEADVSGGFEPGTTYYELVPTDPSALGLYEASVSETIQKYLASHLVLLDDGLWIVLDDNGYRMHLMANGWEVVDASGDPINAAIVDGQGHVTQTIGKLAGLHLTMTESRLAFAYPNGGSTTEVAWIEVDPATGASSFQICNIVVVNELRIGSWKWYERAGGNLSLKWIGA